MATLQVMGYLSLLSVALIALFRGLEALATHPIAGVLLILAGMALSLYGSAGLCGAYLSRKAKEYP